MTARSGFAGLLVRRECWVLSWRGRLLLAALLGAALAGLGYAAYPFLAVTERVPANILVIEGWTGTAVMRQAAAEFKGGGYRSLVLVRTVLGADDEDGRLLGQRLADALERFGVPRQRMVALFPDVARKDRTYHSAKAVVEWLESQSDPEVEGINVATVGPHARRSRLLYRKAFHGICPVGVVSLQTPSYDPARWWRSSEGVRDVIGEIIAFSYSRLLFREPAAVAGSRVPP